MFMMSVDGRIWNGQFTGSRTDWEHALKLLKTLKSTQDAKPAEATTTGTGEPKALEPARSDRVAVVVADHPDGPWSGRLPNGIAVELLGVGEDARWWHRNGMPLAAPPLALNVERRSLPPQPDFVRRAFVATG